MVGEIMLCPISYDGKPGRDWREEGTVWAQRKRSVLNIWVE